jgi:hypothetical protein
MNQDELLKRLHKLQDAVKFSLRKQGLVVPIKTGRGLKLDSYEIVLTDTGYTIYNRWGEEEYQFINYLQTAVLVANCLALEKPIKPQWLMCDKQAGATDFDIKLYEDRFRKSMKKKDMFGIHHYNNRLTETKLKHKHQIRVIDSAYSTLLQSLKRIEKSNKYS